MRTILPVLVAAAVSFAAAGPAAAAPTAGPEPTRQLFDDIAKRDAELFDAAFNRCDIRKLGEIVTDDVEFIHDKWGQTSKSKAEFVGMFQRVCDRQASGEDYRARRELVPGSMSVHPINNYGVMQMGEHRFYKLTPGKPEELVETGRFIDIWRKEGTEWKLFRVISYDHRLAK